MSAVDRERELAALVRAAKGQPNGETAWLDERIRGYEVRYEMKSDEMLRRLAAGQLTDTADIAKWTMLLYARDRG